MGFFLWGIALGWAACAIYHYSQNADSKVGNGAFIITVLILIAAFAVSVSLGIESGAVGGGLLTPTPTSLGR